MNHTKKAQGTIEYLVIIAIVIVIALVVVGLLLQLMGQGTGVSETSAKATWKSAEPWAITDWTKSTTGPVTVVLKNNSSDVLNLVDVNLTSATADKNTDGLSNRAFLNIAPGASINVAINGMVVACTAGTKYSYPKAGIAIDYNNSNIRKTQYANADLVGTC